MAFNSLKEIELAVKTTYGNAVKEDDAAENGITLPQSEAKMSALWNAMKESLSGYDKNLKSNSGLVGGDGERMRAFVEAKNNISGDFCGSVIAAALSVAECNACMRRIVAAPTAGSCGVLPAVLVTYEQKYGATEEQMLEALYVSAGIGQVIASRAYIAGATGGCQAEIGAASAMAAGALVSLRGGDSAKINTAAAMALKNLLGLVCDPVGGLVEVPCVKRNVIGAMNAIAAADMAMAGIYSKIDPDDVIDAMKEVGDKMNPAFKETGEGSLATTDSARRILSGK
jgi:L-serine dehydratase